MGGGTAHTSISVRPRVNRKYSNKCVKDIAEWQCRTKEERRSVRSWCPQLQSEGEIYKVTPEDQRTGVPSGVSGILSLPLECSRNPIPRTNFQCCSLTVTIHLFFPYSCLEILVRISDTLSFYLFSFSFLQSTRPYRDTPSYFFPYVLSLVLWLVIPSFLFYFCISFSVLVRAQLPLLFKPDISVLSTLS